MWYNTSALNGAVTDRPTAKINPTIQRRFLLKVGQVRFGLGLGRVGNLVES